MPEIKEIIRKIDSCPDRIFFNLFFCLPSGGDDLVIATVATNPEAKNRELKELKKIRITQNQQMTIENKVKKGDQRQLNDGSQRSPPD